MIRLRPGQQEVASYQGGLMAVPAVPGAGKTTVLAHLAAELIAAEKVKPGKILIVTVMNSAVANFRSRIGGFLEDRSLPRSAGYEVKTLHSLAMTILKEKPEFLLINSGFQMLDEVRQDEAVKAVASNWLAANPGRWQGALKLDPDKDARWYQRALGNWQQKDLPEFFKQSVSYIKAQGIGPSAAQELLAQLDGSSYLAWALEVYLDYAKVLRGNGQLDFDDLIAQALRLLQEDPGVLQRLRRRWTYIFEDEAQDSNPLQEKILMLLAGESGNLVRVGDSNQAIMGTFTSAEPEIFRSFCRREDVVNAGILVSSRSTRQVIDLANHLVDWSGREHPQPQCRTALEPQAINPVETDDPFPNPVVDGYTLGVKQYRTRTQELSEVARLASKQCKKRPDYTLAVLVPTRAMQQELAEQLSALGAPFEEVGRVTEEQARTVSDIKLVLDYLAQPHRVDGLLSVLTKVLLSGVSEEGQAGLSQLFQRYSLEEVIYPVGEVFPWLNLPDEFGDKELYSGFTTALARVRKWLEASVILPPEDLILFLAEEMELVGEQSEIAHNLALLIKQRVSENPNWRLIDIARDLPRLEESLKHFAKVIYEQKGFTPKPGVVTLLTTHKSKGLEWDTVYLVGVTSGEYPSRTSDKFRSDLWYLKEEGSNPMALVKAELNLVRGGNGENDPVERAKLAEISERLRLLYVAITRARKNLLISYHAEGLYNKKMGPSLALTALQEFMAAEGTKYAKQ